MTNATLARQTYTRLRELIARGELPPGTRLVNRTLAAQLGVSMTPLREAINRLATEGLLTYVAGAGASVRRLDRQELAELYELRLMFEPEAAAFSAERATPDDLDELDDICRDWDALLDELEAQGDSFQPDHYHRWLEGEMHFHRVLVRATRNRWLAKVVDELQVSTRVFNAHRGRMDLLTPQLARETVATKRTLLRAMRERDADLARALSRGLILKGRASVLSRFEQMNSEASAVTGRIQEP